MEYLFVYGTLKKGFSNHHVMGDATLILRDCKVKDMILHRGPGFPYATPRKGEYIFGELYRISDLDDCDRLEGYPYHYLRKKVQIDGSNIKAWMYYVENDSVKNYPETTHEWI